MRRTRIQDYKEVDKADDLERIVHDKRKNKRASKRKEYAVIEDIKINFLVF